MLSVLSLRSLSSIVSKRAARDDDGKQWKKKEEPIKTSWKAMNEWKNKNTQASKTIPHISHRVGDTSVPNEFGALHIS